jgi:hypothetical protein
MVMDWVASAEMALVIHVSVMSYGWACRPTQEGDGRIRELTAWSCKLTAHGEAFQVVSEPSGWIGAFFLLMRSGNDIAVPFSLRENGHESEDPPLHPQEKAL